ncbi:MAG TPA: N-acetylmuramic acid 6-phosphate etherase [Bacilli bacterium]
MIEDIQYLTTEQLNTKTLNIDQLSTLEILQLINKEDEKVALAVRDAIPQIVLAVEKVAEQFRKGGRLFYFGAGTSGRIGILDASECPPTFGTDPKLVQGIIAGGQRAITDSIEGAEDNDQMGEQDAANLHIGPSDVVVGIAASGRTPYVLGAMRQAKKSGAAVIGVCNNRDSLMNQFADIMIEAIVGPEVIMGSTRMKAGTAQKMILNMITTVSMIKLGKVYGNLMVDLLPSNTKLKERAKRIIKLATNTTDEIAARLYDEAEGNVKLAIISFLANVDCRTAEKLLQQTDGSVREAIQLGNSMKK